eukprot:2343554-Ditylum_brightwellii.AAC.1
MSILAFVTSARRRRMCGVMPTAWQKEKNIQSVAQSCENHNFKKRFFQNHSAATGTLPSTQCASTVSHDSCATGAYCMLFHFSLRTTGAIVYQHYVTISSV